MSCLEKCFDCLASEARELYLGRFVTELEDVPSPLEFLRRFVSQNKPLVIRGGCKHWPAITKWSNQYLRKKIGVKEVTVAVTPNGYADAVSDGKFTLPEERKVSVSDFLDILEQHEEDTAENKKELKSATNGVFYLQKQNSSLLTEFSELVEDVEVSISWAEEAFGCSPDAVNFWMGEESAVTSLHKDNYENIYCVIKGCKTFTLLPPTDQPFVPYEYYPVAQFAYNGDGTFRLDEQGGEKVRWTSIDPTKSSDNMKPIEVKVYSGDILYLPSLWFHHVRQSHGCIAVNYWYDMEYDIKYNYFKFVESLVESRKQISRRNCCNLVDDDKI